MRSKRFIGVVAALLMAVAGLAASPKPEASAHGDDVSHARPSLPLNAGTEHFVIHYTLSGGDAVDSTDADGNGMPDYVELVGQTLELAWNVEVNQMGWTAPPLDSGEEGDTRLDIYLMDVMADGYAGYVETTGGFIGDNPNSPERERNAAYAFMVLDNDYTEIEGLGYDETPTQLLQVTVAHEFHHMIQAGYDDSDPHFWFYEASATWMEDEVFDEVNDGVYYLEAVFDSPDTCLVSEGGSFRSEDEGKWYGSWLFLRHMTEKYGSDVVRTAWENSRRLSGFDAINTALQPFNTDLIQESRSYFVANLLRAYEEGSLYPTVVLAGTASGGTFRPVDGVQSLGADYVLIQGSGVVSLSLGTTVAPLHMQAVGIRGGEADVIPQVGSEVVVNMDAYQEVVLVIHNDDVIESETQCYFVDYAVTVNPAGSSLSPVAATYSTVNYVAYTDGVPIADEGGNNGAPTGGGFTGAPFIDEEASDSYSQSPEELNVNFDILLPGELPPGYEFDYAYIQTSEELGSAAVYYIPDGDASANFDYLDQAQNWLSIAESPTSYADVNEWIEDIGYYNTPGEVRVIAGVEVLVEDLSEGIDTWHSATFVVDGLFFVVDGDVRESDVIFLVESLITAAGTGAAPAPQPTTQPQAAEPASPQVDPAPLTAPGNTTATADDWVSLVEQATALLGTFGMLLCCGGLCLVGAGGVAGVALMFRRNK